MKNSIFLFVFVMFYNFSFANVGYHESRGGNCRFELERLKEENYNLRMLLSEGDRAIIHEKIYKDCNL